MANFCATLIIIVQPQLFCNATTTPSQTNREGAQNEQIETVSQPPPPALIHIKQRVEVAFPLSGGSASTTSERGTSETTRTTARSIESEVPSSSSRGSEKSDSEKRRQKLHVLAALREVSETKRREEGKMKTKKPKLSRTAGQQVMKKLGTGENGPKKTGELEKESGKKELVQVQGQKSPQHQHDDPEPVDPAVAEVAPAVSLAAIAEDPSGVDEDEDQISLSALLSKSRKEDEERLDKMNELFSKDWKDFRNKQIQEENEKENEKEKEKEGEKETQKEKEKEKMDTDPSPDVYKEENMYEVKFFFTLSLINVESNSD